jgi:cytochrome c-type biogenesis protein CcmH
MIKPSSLLALVLLVGFAVLPLIAQQQADRVKTLGGEYLCMCGCGQILNQCNHVGCTKSASMLKELRGWVARGDSDDAIEKAFVAEYGTTVYAEPPKKGFGLVAWLMPVFYSVVGLGLLVFVVRKMRERQIAAAPAAPSVHTETLERARAQAARETEE